MTTRTFLIGYNKPVFKYYNLNKVISYQFCINKNGKLYKEYDKNKWV